MKSSCEKETAQEEVAPNVSIGTACLTGSSSLVAVSDKKDERYNTGNDDDSSLGSFIDGGPYVWSYLYICVRAGSR